MDPKPVAVARVPVLVPAGQAADWTKRVESICAPLGVRARATAEPGRTATLYVFELRGTPEGLREAQGKLQLLVGAIALEPAVSSKKKRMVVAAVSFFGGLVAVILLFSLANG